MSQGAPAIEARGITFAYPGDICALSDVAFRAAPGEFVAVVGSNGSGKTTLMKVLLGLLAPQRGEVLLGGEDIRRLPAQRLYATIGMVFQNPADQLFAPTVEQDVAFGPRNLGLGEDEIAWRVELAIEAVGVSALRQRPVHRLSFGEQKRVCMAGVLAMRPWIIVLDEPTAGLDPVGESRMIDLLMRLNREQRITMIVSTHAVDLLPVMADRVCVLHKGRMVHDGPPRDILADPEAAARAGLRLPLIAHLFHEMGRTDGLCCDPLPLTAADGRRQILRWLERDGGVLPTEKP